MTRLLETDKIFSQKYKEIVQDKRLKPPSMLEKADDINDEE